MERDDIRFSEKLLQWNKFDSFLWLWKRIVCQHFHAEAKADARKNAAYLTHADDTSGLAVEIEARESRKGEVEIACVDSRLVDVPVQRHEQG